VIGLDLDPEQIGAATAFVSEQNLTNAEILQRNAYETGLPSASFNLVHARFLFAPVGRDMQLLHEMLRLVRSGGVLAIQEPDSVALDMLPTASSLGTANERHSRGIRQRRG